MKKRKERLCDAYFFMQQGKILNFRQNCSSCWEAADYSAAQLMRGVIKREIVRTASERPFSPVSGRGSGAAHSELAVIVLLMNDGEVRAGVDGVPALGAGIINHPVIPAGASDGEIRDLFETGAREDEIVAAGAGVRLPRGAQALQQRGLPVRVKVQGLFHAQIPAPPDDEETLHRFTHPAGALHKIGEKQNISVHICQIGAVVQSSAQREDGTYQRRAQRIGLNLRKMRKTKFSSRFGNTGLISNQRNCRVRPKRLPGGQCVALNQRDMRVRKRLWGSEQRD